jgi:hypothetical protein
MNMYHDPSPTVVNRRMGFGTAIVLGITGITMTSIGAGTGIVIYGMRIFNQKSGSLVEFAGETLKHLPEYRKALPPALADAIDDVRKPEYRKQLDVSVKWVSSDSSKRRRRAVIEVKNNGDDTISMLSMRLVGLDGAGEPISEETAYAATPIQIDEDWRGPLLPHETRRFVVSCWDKDVASMTPEITDLRVWRQALASAPDSEDSADSN